MPGTPVNLTASEVTPEPAASKAQADGPVTSPVAGVAALSSKAAALASQVRVSPLVLRS